MTSTTFIKHTGIQHLLLPGMLLFALVPSEASTTTAPTTASAVTTTTDATTTLPPTSSTSYTTQPPTTTTGISATSVSAPGMGTTSGASMTWSSSSMSTSMTSNSSMMSNTSMNGTQMSNATSMNMIYCPSFSCNYSDCYSMYSSQNATSCSAYCQLVRQMGMCYTVSCSASCAERCFNASQINCSVDCCNFTGCLNDSFASMVVYSSVVPTTAATAAPTTSAPRTTIKPTAVNNENKCIYGKCESKECYKEFKTVKECTSQPHCQLKYETIGSVKKWTAGCANCTGYTACPESNPTPPCHQECCNVTTASCLFLNGTRNFYSFATRGPYYHIELMASLIFLFAITSLM
ncbi:uncharacterized protein KZ484_025097 [Pholidichthys leucotaenia]